MVSSEKGDCIDLTRPKVVPILLIPRTPYHAVLCHQCHAEPHTSFLFCLIYVVVYVFHAASVPMLHLFSSPLMLHLIFFTSIILNLTLHLLCLISWSMLWCMSFVLHQSPCYTSFHYPSCYISFHSTPAMLHPDWHQFHVKSHTSLYFILVVVYVLRAAWVTSFHYLSCCISSFQLLLCCTSHHPCLAAFLPRYTYPYLTMSCCTLKTSPISFTPAMLYIHSIPHSAMPYPPKMHPVMPLLIPPLVTRRATATVTAHRWESQYYRLNLHHNHIRGLLDTRPDSPLIPARGLCEGRWGAGQTPHYLTHTDGPAAASSSGCWVSHLILPLVRLGSEVRCVLCGDC